MVEVTGDEKWIKVPGAEMENPFEKVEGSDEELEGTEEAVGVEDVLGGVNDIADESVSMEEKEVIDEDQDSCVGLSDGTAQHINHEPNNQTRSLAGLHVLLGYQNRSTEATERSSEDQDTTTNRSHLLLLKNKDHKWTLLAGDRELSGYREAAPDSGSLGPEIYPISHRGQSEGLQAPSSELRASLSSSGQTATAPTLGLVHSTPDGWEETELGRSNSQCTALARDQNPRVRRPPLQRWPRSSARPEPHGPASLPPRQRASRQEGQSQREPREELTDWLQELKYQSLQLEPPGVSLSLCFKPATVVVGLCHSLSNFSASGVSSSPLQGVTPGHELSHLLEHHIEGPSLAATPPPWCPPSRGDMMEEHGTGSPE
uniref:uncharacterized protein LOC118526364 n=1 Tax=Halichoerus grypus TaxID=9711 RepID=UPI0016598C73|nr:uncharacterized protein LOC118526364 [Halichoerus grypus]